jgi:hypothetical protein
MKDCEDAFYRAKASVLGANITIKGSGKKLVRLRRMEVQEIRPTTPYPSSVRMPRCSATQLCQRFSQCRTSRAAAASPNSFSHFTLKILLLHHSSVIDCIEM